MPPLGGMLSAVCPHRLRDQALKHSAHPHKRRPANQNIKLLVRTRDLALALIPCQILITNTSKKIKLLGSGIYIGHQSGEAFANLS